MSDSGKLTVNKAEIENAIRHNIHMSSDWYGDPSLAGVSNAVEAVMKLIEGAAQIQPALPQTIQPVAWEWLDLEGTEFMVSHLNIPEHLRAVGMSSRPLYASAGRAALTKDRPDAR